MEKTEKRDTEKWKHREKKEDTQNKRDTKHKKYRVSWGFQKKKSHRKMETYKN